MITEIKKEIEEKYIYKTELHSHTLPISRCSEFTAERLIEAYKSTGVHSIVLTNHFTPVHIKEKTKEDFLRDYCEAFEDLKNYAKEAGISAIFGIELRFSENCNDYLIFGIDQSDLSDIYDCVDKGLEYFGKMFRRRGALIIWAHPKRDRMTEIDKSLVDGLEVFNMHPGQNSRVALAAYSARESGLTVTGGTDFHHPGHEASCLLRTSRRMESSYDIADVLRSKEYVLDIGGSIALP